MDSKLQKYRSKVMSAEEERILRRLVEMVAESYGVDVSVAEIGG